MKLAPWMVLLSLSLVAACSGSKSANKVDESSPQVELSDADEFVENPAEEAASEVAMNTDEAAVDEAVAEANASTTEDESVNINDELTPTEPVKVAKTSPDFEPGALKQYKVEKNETLMMIAFKLYGDYGKWKNLVNDNQDVLKGNTSVREGMILKYNAPAEEFVWNPAGSPYLIRTGDTLGTISKSVYQTMSKWKLLWENNRPLIKDPNKIYAGFTIYYVDGREVASEL